MRSKVLITVFWGLLAGCTSSSTNSRMEFDTATIVSRKAMPSVLSASGMVAVEDYFYIVGDDSPFLYQVGRDGLVREKIQIWEADTNETGRVAKPVKRDYELMELIPGTTRILLLGSGSVPGMRDYISIWDYAQGDSVRSWHVPELYEFWLRVMEKQEDGLNLEGLAFSGDHMFLFDRESWAYLEIKTADFIAYLEGYGSMPQLSSVTFNPGESATEHGGFSGAAVLPDSREILVSVSTEARKGAYNDGAIGGSYLGLLYLSGPNAAFPELIPVLENGVHIPLKIESVCVTGKNQDGSWQVFAVTDSDGGESELLELRVGRGK